MNNYHKYREAASLLQELLGSGQVVIDELTSTESKAYVNKKKINQHVEDVINDIKEE